MCVKRQFCCMCLSFFYCLFHVSHSESTEQREQRHGTRWARGLRRCGVSVCVGGGHGVCDARTGLCALWLSLFVRECVPCATLRE